MSSPAGTAGLMLGPTPVQPADRLGAALGLTTGVLWIKRDDLTPLAGGGNKVRKLDHLCADAIACGADVLVTGGGAQSNHVRLTAAAARRTGLDCVVVLAGEQPAGASGNLVIDALLGPTVRWSGPGGLPTVERRIGEVAEELSARGRRPYPIPVGGANVVGSRGYLTVAEEIRAQLPGGEVTLVVVPAGSGGTQAGMAAGFGTHDRVLGVNVGAFPDVAARVRRLAEEVARDAGLPAPTGEVRVDDRYAAAGYGAELEPVRRALRLAAHTEALILDPVYTGKALAGLAAGLAEGSVKPEGPIVFVHCGGVYGLLSDRYSGWAAAPESAS